MAGATYPSLKERTVLVTGGGSGIGAATVARFAAQGANVAFLDIADEPSRLLEAELAGQGHRVRYWRCDLTDVEALRAAVDGVREAFGPVTVLVNNAANDTRHDFLSMTPEGFDAGVAVNLRHAYFAAQAVMPDMIAAGGGSIINYGSISWMIGAGDLTVYATLKSAAHGLTKELARQFGPHNVRVNCIVPGWVMTQRQLDLWVTPEVEAVAMAAQCLKRRLMPDELAAAVLFLASDESSGITSQSLVVDNGWV